LNREDRVAESAPSIFGAEFDDASEDGDNPALNTDMSWLDEDEAATPESGGVQPTPAAAPTDGGQGETQQTPSTQPVAPTAEQPPAQGEPAPGQEAAAGEQAPSQEGTQLIGGRFKDVDALLKSYNELRKEYNQTLAREQAQALRDAQSQTQQPQQQRPSLTPEEAQALLADPQRLEHYIRSLAQEQATQEVSQLQSQQLQQQLVAVAEQFMTTHPEVTPDSPLDEAMGEVIQFFQKDEQSGRQVYDYYPVTRENLEFAYEMAKDPNLFQAVKELDMIPNERNLSIAKEAVADPAFKMALKANLSALEDETGEAIDFVRRVAKMPGLYDQAVTNAQPPTPEQVRTAAFVETGGTGAPIQSAPGQRPEKDELDQDIDEWEKSAGNVFGLIPING